MVNIATLKIPLPAFRSAAQMVHGPGSLNALRGLHGNRVTVVIGRSLADNSERLGRLRKAIRAGEQDIVVRDWEGEPSIADLAPALKRIEVFHPDVLIAVGGGSVIDATKVLWLLYEHPDLPRETMLRPFAVPPLRGQCRFVAIPTTTGTGSEVSSAAVLYDATEHRKVAVVTHDFLPDLVILDPMMVEGLPRPVMTATMCDALSHAIEGYVSNIVNPLMDVFAEAAVRDIAAAASPALDGDDRVIGRLQYAAMMAGWVQNHCLVGASHAVAHQLKEFSHGAANALLLPSVIRANALVAGERYSRLARAANVGDNAEALARLVEDLRSKGGLPDGLGWLSSDRLEEIVASSLLDPAVRSNPVPMDHAFVNDLLGAVR